MRVGYESEDDLRHVRREGEGRKADFPARSPITLSGSQDISYGRAQQKAKLNPLSTSQSHLSLDRIAQHQLWN